jgi:hypothetical protein
MMAIEPWIKDVSLRQLVGIAEFLGFLGITVFLASKVKWPRFIWVIAAYLGILLMLYYGFYNPLGLVIEGWPSLLLFLILLLVG